MNEQIDYRQLALSLGYNIGEGATFTSDAERKLLQEAAVHNYQYHYDALKNDPGISNGIERKKKALGMTIETMPEARQVFGLPEKRKDVSELLQPSTFTDFILDRVSDNPEELNTGISTFVKSFSKEVTRPFNEFHYSGIDGVDSSEFEDRFKGANGDLIYDKDMTVNDFMSLYFDKTDNEYHKRLKDLSHYADVPIQRLAKDDELFKKTNESFLDPDNNKEYQERVEQEKIQKYRDEHSAFWRGAAGTGNMLLAGGYGALGWLGDVTSFDGLRDYGYRKSIESMEDAQKYPMYGATEVWDKPELWASYVGELMGSFIPTAVLGGTGGIAGKIGGGILAKKIATKAAQEGAETIFNNAVKKQATKLLAKNTAKKAGEKLTVDAFTDQAKDIVTKRLIDKVGSIGTGLPFAVTETGQMWSDDAKKRGVENANALTSALFGTASGMSEALGIMGAFSKTLRGVKNDAVRSFLKRTTMMTGEEAGQEVFQTWMSGLNEVVNDPSLSLKDSMTVKDAVDSAVAAILTAGIYHTTPAGAAVAWKKYRNRNFEINSGSDTDTSGNAFDPTSETKYRYNRANLREAAPDTEPENFIPQVVKLANDEYVALHEEQVGRGKTVDDARKDLNTKVNKGLDRIPMDKITQKGELYTTEANDRTVTAGSIDHLKTLLNMHNNEDSSVSLVPNSRTAIVKLRDGNYRVTIRDKVTDNVTKGVAKNIAVAHQIAKINFIGNNVATTMTVKTEKPDVFKLPTTVSGRLDVDKAVSYLKNEFGAFVYHANKSKGTLKFFKNGIKHEITPDKSVGNNGDSTVRYTVKSIDMEGEKTKNYITTKNRNGSLSDFVMVSPTVGLHLFKTAGINIDVGSIYNVAERVPGGQVLEINGKRAADSERISEIDQRVRHFKIASEYGVNEFFVDKRGRVKTQNSGQVFDVSDGFKFVDYVDANSIKERQEVLDQTIQGKGYDFIYRDDEHALIKHVDPRGNILGYRINRRGNIREIGDLDSFDYLMLHEDQSTLINYGEEEINSVFNTEDYRFLEGTHIFSDVAQLKQQNKRLYDRMVKETLNNNDTMTTDKIYGFNVGGKIYLFVGNILQGHNGKAGSVKAVWLHEVAHAHAPYIFGHNKIRTLVKDAASWAEMDRDSTEYRVFTTAKERAERQFEGIKADLERRLTSKKINQATYDKEREKLRKKETGEILSYIIEDVIVRDVSLSTGNKRGNKRYETWAKTLQKELTNLVKSVAGLKVDDALNLTPEDFVTMAHGLATHRGEKRVVIGDDNDSDDSVDYSLADINFSVANVRSVVSKKGAVLDTFIDRYKKEINADDAKNLRDLNIIATRVVSQMEKNLDSFIVHPSKEALEQDYHKKIGDYDPSKLSHVRATELTRRLYGKREAGRLASFAASNASRIERRRKANLRSTIEWLTNNSTIEPVESVIALLTMTEFNVRRIPNRKTGDIEFKAVKLTEKSSDVGITFSGNVMNIFIENLRNGMSKKKAIGDAVAKDQEMSMRANIEKGYEGVKFFPQSTKQEDVIEFNRACAGTPWCVATSKPHAETNLGRGDFYVDYDYGKPRIAIHVNGDKLLEISGTEENQSLKPEEEERLFEIAKEGEAPNLERYLSRQEFFESADVEFSDYDDPYILYRDYSRAIDRNVVDKTGSGMNEHDFSRSFLNKLTEMLLLDPNAEIEIHNGYVIVRYSNQQGDAVISFYAGGPDGASVGITSVSSPEMMKYIIEDLFDYSDADFDKFKFTNTGLPEHMDIQVTQGAEKHLHSYLRNLQMEMFNVYTTFTNGEAIPKGFHAAHLNIKNKFSEYDKVFKDTDDVRYLSIYQERSSQIEIGPNAPIVETISMTPSSGFSLSIDSSNLRKINGFSEISNSRINTELNVGSPNILLIHDSYVRSISDVGQVLLTAGAIGYTDATVRPPRNNTGIVNDGMIDINFNTQYIQRRLDGDKLTKEFAYQRTLPENGFRSKLGNYMLGEAWVLAQTPTFKEWFDDGVKDENGDPLLLQYTHVNSTYGELQDIRDLIDDPDAVAPRFGYIMRPEKTVRVGKVDSPNKTTDVFFVRKKLGITLTEAYIALSPSLIWEDILPRLPDEIIQTEQASVVQEIYNATSLDRTDDNQRELHKELITLLNENGIVLSYDDVFGKEYVITDPSSVISLRSLGIVTAHNNPWVFDSSSVADVAFDYQTSLAKLNDEMSELVRLKTEYSVPNTGNYSDSQWLFLQTPTFRDWFTDSEVTDNDDNPVILNEVESEVGGVYVSDESYNPDITTPLSSDVTYVEDDLESLFSDNKLNVRLEGYTLRNNSTGEYKNMGANVVDGIPVVSLKRIKSEEYDAAKYTVEPVYSSDIESSIVGNADLIQEINSDVRYIFDSKKHQKFAKAKDIKKINTKGEYYLDYRYEGKVLSELDGNYLFEGLTDEDGNIRDYYVIKNGKIKETGHVKSATNSKKMSLTDYKILEARGSITFSYADTTEGNNQFTDDIEDDNIQMFYSEQVDPTFFQADEFGVTADRMIAEKEQVVKNTSSDKDLWLKASDGRDTNLSMDQWILTRTETFRDFFRDSKAINDDGEPAPMYLTERAINENILEFTSKRPADNNVFVSLTEEDDGYVVRVNDVEVRTFDTLVEAAKMRDTLQNSMSEPASFFIRTQETIEDGNHVTVDSLRDVRAAGDKSIASQLFMIRGLKYNQSDRDIFTRASEVLFNNNITSIPEITPEGNVKFDLPSGDALVIENVDTSFENLQKAVDSVVNHTTEFQYDDNLNMSRADEEIEAVFSNVENLDRKGVSYDEIMSYVEQLPPYIASRVKLYMNEDQEAQNTFGEGVSGMFKLFGTADKTILVSAYPRRTLREILTTIAHEVSHFSDFAWLTSEFRDVYTTLYSMLKGRIRTEIPQYYNAYVGSDSAIIDDKVKMLLVHEYFAFKGAAIFDIPENFGNLTAEQVAEIKSQVEGAFTSLDLSVNRQRKSNAPLFEAVLRANLAPAIGDGLRITHNFNQGDQKFTINVRTTGEFGVYRRVTSTYHGNKKIQEIQDFINAPTTRTGRYLRKLLVKTWSPIYIDGFIPKLNPYFGQNIMGMNSTILASMSNIITLDFAPELKGYVNELRRIESIMEDHGIYDVDSDTGFFQTLTQAGVTNQEELTVAKHVDSTMKNMEHIKYVNVVRIRELFLETIAVLRKHATSSDAQAKLAIWESEIMRDAKRFIADWDHTRYKAHTKEDVDNLQWMLDRLTKQDQRPSIQAQEAVKRKQALEVMLANNPDKRDEYRKEIKKQNNIIENYQRMVSLEKWAQFKYSNTASIDRAENNSRAINELMVKKIKDTIDRGKSTKADLSIGTPSSMKATKLNMQKEEDRMLSAFLSPITNPFEVSLYNLNEQAKTISKLRFNIDYADSLIGTGVAQIAGSNTLSFAKGDTDFDFIKNGTLLKYIEVDPQYSEYIQEDLNLTRMIQSDNMINRLLATIKMNNTVLNPKTLVSNYESNFSVIGLHGHLFNVSQWKDAMDMVKNEYQSRFTSMKVAESEYQKTLRRDLREYYVFGSGGSTLEMLLTNNEMWSTGWNAMMDIAAKMEIISKNKSVNAQAEFSQLMNRFRETYAYGDEWVKIFSYMTHYNMEMLRAKTKIDNNNGFRHSIEALRKIAVPRAIEKTIEETTQWYVAPSFAKLLAGQHGRLFFPDFMLHHYQMIRTLVAAHKRLKDNAEELESLKGKTDEYSNAYRKALMADTFRRRVGGALFAGNAALMMGTGATMLTMTLNALGAMFAGSDDDDDDDRRKVLTENRTVVGSDYESSMKILLDMSGNGSMLRSPMMFQFGHNLISVNDHRLHAINAIIPTHPASKGSRWLEMGEQVLGNFLNMNADNPTFYMQLLQLFQGENRYGGTMTDDETITSIADIMLPGVAKWMGGVAVGRNSFTSQREMPRILKALDITGVSIRSNDMRDGMTNKGYNVAEAMSTKNNGVKKDIQKQMWSGRKLEDSDLSQYVARMIDNNKVIFEDAMYPISAYKYKGYRDNEIVQHLTSNRKGGSTGIPKVVAQGLVKGENNIDKSDISWLGNLRSRIANKKSDRQITSEQRRNAIDNLNRLIRLYRAALVRDRQ